MTPFNFIRIGIAKAISHSVMTRPRFNHNWKIEEDDVLDGLWKDIKTSLSSERFGVYFAFRRVFGEEPARSAGERGEFPVPPRAS
jgi:hypothetical protein